MKLNIFGYEFDVYFLIILFILIIIININLFCSLFGSFKKGILFIKKTILIFLKIFKNVLNILNSDTETFDNFLEEENINMDKMINNIMNDNSVDTLVQTKNSPDNISTNDTNIKPSLPNISMENSTTQDSTISEINMDNNSLPMESPNDLSATDDTPLTDDISATDNMIKQSDTYEAFTNGKCDNTRGGNNI